MFHSHDPKAAARFIASEVGRHARLTAHFCLGEFASGDGADEVLVHPALLHLLETVRAHFGRPVRINSGYRTVQHNRAVGGKPQSRHLLGMAADIAVEGTPPAAVQTYAETLGVGGLGRYKTFTHLDVEGQYRRW